MNLQELEIVPKPGIDPEALVRHILTAGPVRSCQVVRGNIRITWNEARMSAKKLVKFVARYQEPGAKPTKRNIASVRNVKPQNLIKPEIEKTS